VTDGSHRHGEDPAVDEPAERAALHRDELPAFDPAPEQEPPLVAEHAWGAPTQMSSELPGVPDHFQRLWTPYRMVYIQQGQMPDEHACPFCRAPELSDDQGLIVARGETCFVLLNLYPYNTGHMMVCPYRHVGLYDQATTEEVAEMAVLTQTAMRVLAQVTRCQGFNIGMNQGRIAGAGIADHLHQHIVPRWSLDSNFFPIIAKTKALPILLEDMRQDIQAAWPA